MYRWNRPEYRARIVLAAAVLAATVGCSAKKPIQIVNKPSQDALSDWLKASEAAVKAVDGNLALNSVAGRNLAISYSEAAVLSRYMGLRNSLTNGRSVAKVAFDVVDLGLTAAVPISNGTRGKTILGSLATGFKGTNLSIDRNVFDEQSTAAILSALDTCVLRARGVIAAKFGFSADQYTVFQGYSDLTRLYGCTTMAGALQELSENQAVAAKEQQNTLIAPVTQQSVSDLQQLAAAFGASAAGDKKLAAAFLKEMKGPDISESSSREELLAAFRGLRALLDRPAELARMFQAARSVKLLPAS
jgi:hypothetical protein